MASVEKDRDLIAEQAFAGVDIIVLPTLVLTVPTVEEAASNVEKGVAAENTAFANYYGLPAISIPCAFDSHDMPIGLQIVGKPGGDRTVLNVANQYECVAKQGLIPAGEGSDLLESISLIPWCKEDPHHVIADCLE